MDGWGGDTSVLPGTFPGSLRPSPLHHRHVFDGHYGDTSLGDTLHSGDPRSVEPVNPESDGPDAEASQLLAHIQTSNLEAKVERERKTGDSPGRQHWFVWRH